jgi:hypothetical protein
MRLARPLKLSALIVLFIAALAGIAVAGAEPDRDRASATDAGRVKLRVAICVDGAKPTLEFIVENGSDKPLENHPMGRDSNRFEVLCPDGTIAGGSISVGAWVPGTPYVLPGKSFRHQMTQERLVEFCRMKERGDYRLVWCFGDAKSPELLLTRNADERRIGAANGADKAAAAERISTPKGAILSLLRELDGDRSGARAADGVEGGRE